MLKLLIDFFTKKVEELPKDELIGVWTNEDDGSGIINIFGWSVHFLENGKGKSSVWESKTMESYDFEWIRENINSIKLKCKEEKWEIITYKIEEYIGAYESKQFKLTEIDKEIFWNSPEPLFKRR